MNALTSWTANPGIYTSPEMVAELALGAEPPLDIAHKYGMTPDEFGFLQAQPWFVDAVYRKREELQANGVTFQAKAKMMLEEGLTDLFKLSKTGQMAANLTLELTKQLAEVAGVKQQAKLPQTENAPTFAINIVLPDNPAGPSQRHVEATTIPQAPPMVIDLKARTVDTLPPKPQGFTVPDFKMNDDLTAGIGR